MIFLHSILCTNPISDVIRKKFGTKIHPKDSNFDISFCVLLSNLPGNLNVMVFEYYPIMFPGISLGMDMCCGTVL